MKTVYLAGAIHGCDDLSCNWWRDQATRLLGESFRVLNPMSRDYRGVESANVQEIVNGDLLLIASSEIVLVNATAPSWGTAMEVRYAFTVGRPVVAFTAAESISPWLKYHCSEIKGNVAMACSAVMSIAQSRGDE
jgi:nucleoside 2-deoxyribosyltransferase